MADQPSIIVLPDGTRVHRSAMLPESHDKPLFEGDAQWATGKATVPPLPVSSDGEVIGPRTKSEAERMEATHWQRHLWAKATDGRSNLHAPPPDPLASAKASERPAVTEEMIAKEMKRLVPGGVFGYQANRDLRRRATEAVAARLRSKELAGGTVQGWIGRDAQERKRYSCRVCGASLVELMRRADGAWECVTCARR